jgi:hypothetical protein
MVRKASILRNDTPGEETKSGSEIVRSGAKTRGSGQPGADDLVNLALKACLVARDAAFNISGS